MGESWSDLAAVEYLHEYGFAPQADENPFAIGPYATGDKQAGIRNYGMNASPLNYSDVGYDFVCNANCPLLTQVHADGEIWSATNYDIRQAMHDAATARTRRARRRPATAVQLVFDAWPLMAVGSVSMVDARDAISPPTRSASRRDADTMWNVFASRGLGETALGTAPTTPTRCRASLTLLNEARCCSSHSAAMVRIAGPAVRRTIRGTGHTGRRHRPGTPLDDMFMRAGHATTSSPGRPASATSGRR